MRAVEQDISMRNHLEQFAQQVHGLAGCSSSDIYSNQERIALQTRDTTMLLVLR